MMLVLHDDAKREYASDPARGLPNTSVGTFSAELLTEAEENLRTSQPLIQSFFLTSTIGEPFLNSRPRSGGFGFCE
jgi:hypothetical protein